ncbi:sugar transferase [Crocinitomicaceae bacterium]|nr:sugar transferase [Crocinitomicaceae bacterium]
MIDFYLNHLNLSSSDLQKVNLSDDFKNEGKKIIYLVKPINKFSFFQKKIKKLRKEINDDQYLVFRFQTLKGRIRRIEKKKPRFIAKTQVGLEFFFFRLIPRLFFFRKIYSYLSNETILILSKAEGLGRIVYGGFDIERVENSVSYSYVLASPSEKNHSSKKPSFGPIYGMPRIGKNGKIITVFKIRTMHPYSEFLHEYILKQNGYGEEGKPKNDFRVTTWGRILRKYWIDEIPQIFNVLKGELKLVGLRPVSEVYFNELGEEYRNMRINYKPGCIPPYVALNKKSSKEEVIEAEYEYIKMKKSSPYTTDIILFFRALTNIIAFNKRGT